MISLFFTESTALNLEELGFEHRNSRKSFCLKSIFFVKKKLKCDFLKILKHLISINYNFLSIKDKFYY